MIFYTLLSVEISPDAIDNAGGLYFLQRLFSEERFFTIGR